VPGACGKGPIFQSCIGGLKGEGGGHLTGPDCVPFYAGRDWDLISKRHHYPHANFLKILGLEEHDKHGGSQDECKIGAILVFFHLGKERERAHG